MKLVRDKIPQIIENERGQAPHIIFAPKELRLESLLKKLQEEVDEFTDDNNLEELADIHEVCRALAYELGATPYDVEVIRDHKFAERGGFSKGILLEIK